MSNLWCHLRNSSPRYTLSYVIKSYLWPPELNGRGKAENADDAFFFSRETAYLKIKFASLRSKLTNQNVQKALFTGVVYADFYLRSVSHDLLIIRTFKNSGD